ncbi:MAG: cation-translocating P-type ATPase [Chthoniobacter sp.]|uniref:heavy metal translocating P-type ATPase n=1 Tax=Chthoniobacter sp. TaxID=2510640 RepID=UPI0032AB03D5
MPVPIDQSPAAVLPLPVDKPRRSWLPRVANREVELPDHDHDHEGEWRVQLIASGLCAVFGIAGWLAARGGFPAPALVAFGLAYLAGAWFTAQEVWEKLHHREVDIHFLMLAVAGGAAAIGAWNEGAVLLFLFSFSGALEHYAMERTQNEIRSLFNAAPKTATVLDEAGTETVVSVAELRTGQRLRIKPSDQFPVDAEVVKGETAADESTLTGEAKPVDKAVGDSVLAGTLNLWGVVETVVSRPAQESALQKIIQLIQNAQRNKAPAQRFTDRFGTHYTYGVLALTTVMFFVWWLPLHHRPFVSVPGDVSAFYHAMTLLVVASPCALVLSIPSAILAAIAWGARRGILFRGGAAVEQLAEVKIVAMDKTGTLTSGDLRVEKVESFPPGHEEEVVRLACALDRHSNHPLARAIVRYARQRGIEPIEVTDFAQTSGAGITARCNGRELRLGRRAWAQDTSHADCLAVTPPQDIGVSEVWLSAGDFCGRLLLRDDLRPEARELIDQLRRRGLRTVVLTGDNQGAADFLRTELGLDDVRAGLKPEQKLEIIQSFNKNGSRAAMIGDGVNDAPSLAAAHVGVAMGARGSDAALEQAAVVLMNDRLENFLAAYELSRRARTIIRQNLALSLGVIVVLVTLALFQKIPLTLGVVGHEGSTLVVVLNSLRLLFGPTPASPGK